MRHISLPPIELDWSGFSGELLLDSPADLSTLILKHAQIRKSLDNVDPNINVFRVPGCEVSVSTMSAWREALRQWDHTRSTAR